MESSLTMRDVCSTYLRDAESRGVDIAAARRAVRRADPVLGEEIAAALPYRRLYEYQQSLRARMKPGTVNLEMAYLRAALGHAWRLELIPRIPPFPRQLPARNARKGFLEPSDYTAIDRELPDWARDPFALAYASGWRRCEVLWLRWDEVDLEARFVRLGGDRSKNGESRNLPFDIGDVRAIIRRRLRARIEGFDYVFHREGRRLSITTFWNALSQARRRAGREGKLLHDCRRTAARDLVRSGVPEYHAMQITGHKTREVFRRYNIVDERDLVEAAVLCNRYRRRKAKKGG